MISGLVQRSGPQRAKRCSRNESSLVKRSTIRGAGPSTDAPAVSSRATSSATHRRPLGSVYLAAKTRQLEVSMGSRVRLSPSRASGGPVNATQFVWYDPALIGACSETNYGQILARIALGEADFGANDVADEGVKTGISQVASHQPEAGDDVCDDRFIDARFAGYMLSVDLGHVWLSVRADPPRMG